MKLISLILNIVVTTLLLAALRQIFNFEAAVLAGLAIIWAYVMELESRK